MDDVFFRPKHRIFESLSYGGASGNFCHDNPNGNRSTEDIVQNWTMDEFSLHFWTGMIK